MTKSGAKVLLFFELVNFFLNEVVDAGEKAKGRLCLWVKKRLPEWAAFYNTYEGVLIW